ncbi:MAG: radical SAM protein [Candidatus Omnitrophica bacterium]|nr:radical SAM protein [Candidatus Omnitrophota bacterium]
MELNHKKTFRKAGCLLNKTAIMLTGFSCNNSCIMCSVRELRRTQKDRSTSEILSDISRYRKEGFKRIEFSGGEVTLRKDIFALLRHAKILGFEKVLISTNGRKLKDFNFCKDILSCGLDLSSFSIYGHTSKIHDRITRSEGSFRQTVQGLENFKKINKSGEMVNTVILKYNYQYLKNFCNYFSKDLGIVDWNIGDLIPQGNALNYYKFLAIEPNELSKALKGILEGIENNPFKMVTFFDFPLCFFSPSFRKNPKINFITAMQRELLFSIKGEKIGTRLSRISNKIYYDKFKTRINICKSCLFTDNCGGIWNKYLELFSEEAINKLAKNNKCLT